METTKKGVAASGMSAFMSKTYAWMSAALAVTALAAWHVISDPSVLAHFLRASPEGVALTGLWWGVTLAELALVLFLVPMAARMSPAVAGGCLLAYATASGLTIAPAVSLYTGESVAGTLGVTVAMFGAMSLYGAVTRKDLSSWGTFLFMGLVGLLALMVVNLFVHSTGMSLAIGVAGVFIFSGLAAYDTQKLRDLGATSPGGRLESSMAVLGALTLYLDFINLFLMLLRLIGQKK